ncbi:hypothetical protein Tco_1416149, partial [Tanacetum coccineum]
NALCDNDDEDDEYDDRDVDGDDGDQYRLAKEQEDQLNSEIRSLDMAGTFLPLTIKSLEEVNMKQERDDHVTAVKVDTLKLIIESPKALKLSLPFPDEHSSLTLEETSIEVPVYMEVPQEEVERVILKRLSVGLFRRC